jgi:hypothetical protein
MLLPLLLLLFPTEFTLAQGQWQYEVVDSTSQSIQEILLNTDGQGYPHIFYIGYPGPALRHAAKIDGQWTLNATRFISMPLTAFIIDDTAVVHAVVRYQFSRVLYYRFAQNDTLVDTIIYSSTNSYTDADIIIDYESRPFVAITSQGSDSNLTVGFLYNSHWLLYDVAPLPDYAVDARVLQRHDTTFVVASSGAINFLWRVGWDSWHNEIIDPNVEGQFGFAQDCAGHSFIAYNKYVNGQDRALCLLENTSGAWASHVLDTSGVVLGSRIGIAVAGDGVVNIIYSMRLWPLLRPVIKHAYIDIDGWHIDVIDSTSQILGFYGGIAIDNHDFIGIAYSKEGRLYFARRSSPAMAADEHPSPIPRQTEFFAYPNPFNSATTLFVANRDRAEIAIFDITGRKVASLDAVGGRASWDAAGLSSGVYFARSADDNRGQTIKLILLR